MLNKFNNFQFETMLSNDKVLNLFKDLEFPFGINPQKFSENYELYKKMYQINETSELGPTGNDELGHADRITVLTTSIDLGIKVEEIFKETIIRIGKACGFSLQDKQSFIQVLIKLLEAFPMVDTVINDSKILMSGKNINHKMWPFNPYIRWINVYKNRKHYDIVNDQEKPDFCILYIESNCKEHYFKTDFVNDFNKHFTSKVYIIDRCVNTSFNRDVHKILGSNMIKHIYIDPEVDGVEGFKKICEEEKIELLKSVETKPTNNVPVLIEGKGFIYRLEFNRVNVFGQTYQVLNILKQMLNKRS